MVRKGVHGEVLGSGSKGIYIWIIHRRRLNSKPAVADSLTNKVLGLGSQEAQQIRSPLQRQILLQQSLQSLSSTAEGIAEHQGRFAKVHEQHELHEAGVEKCHLTPHPEMSPHLVCKAAKPQLLQKHQISAPRMVNPTRIKQKKTSTNAQCHQPTTILNFQCWGFALHSFWQHLS